MSGTNFHNLSQGYLEDMYQLDLLYLDLHLIVTRRMLQIGMYIHLHTSANFAMKVLAATSYLSKIGAAYFDTFMIYVNLNDEALVRSRRWKPDRERIKNIGMDCKDLDQKAEFMAMLQSKHAKPSEGVFIIPKNITSDFHNKMFNTSGYLLKQIETVKFDALLSEKNTPQISNINALFDLAARIIKGSQIKTIHETFRLSLYDSIHNNNARPSFPQERDELLHALEDYQEHAARHYTHYQRMDDQSFDRDQKNHSKNYMESRRSTYVNVNWNQKVYR